MINSKYFHLYQVSYNSSHERLLYNFSFNEISEVKKYKSMQSDHRASTAHKRRIDTILRHITPNIHRSASFISYAANNNNTTPTTNVKNSAKQKVNSKKRVRQVDTSSSPNLLNKVIRSFQGSGSLSTPSLQAFNNILFLVNSIPPSLNSLSIFNIMLRSAPKDSDLLPFLAQVKIPKSALGGTDYKTFITTLSRVQAYLPAWYYSSLVLGKSLNNFDTILLYCAQRFAREIKVQNAISGALIYPSIMSVLGLLGITLLLARILPQNISIFESMGLTVPSFLQFANYLVQNVQYHWLALLYLVPSSIAGAKKYLPFRAFVKLEYLKMHTPIGHLRFLQDKATLLYTLSLLDKEQITSKLLLVCTNLSGNVVLQHMIESMAALAKYGATAEEVLSYLLKQKHVFSPYEVAYLQACFMSGKHAIVQDGLRYVSQMVLKEYMNNLQTLLNVLNPLTIVIVGALVLVIALLGIYPLIELTSAVSAT
jgi:type II secretory pathway component PulF